MSSPNNENEEPSSSNLLGNDNASRDSCEGASSKRQRPPAKRRISSTVIEISDTESDDSDVCAVSSYQASADEVKRIRGTDYSSSSSSSEYSSDSESPWEDDSIVIDDYEIDSKPVKAQLNPRANRMDDPKMNPALKEKDVVERLSTHWKELKDDSNDKVTLTCDPFRVCLLHDFLANPEIINNIVDDMNTLDWSRKKMDLYEFHQTTDLASLTWQRSIRGIYELLKTEVMSWVSAVTGLELTSVSASCSLYGPGDHLLVHDDLLADRRVAFILYLAPWRPRPRHATPHNGSQCGDHAHDNNADEESESAGWCSWMGGALQLVRGAGAAGGGGGPGAEGAPGGEVAGPGAVVRHLLPKNNTLAWFQVTNDSYHQVGEVSSLELPRLSINGWFHGPPPPDPPPPPAPAPPPPHAICKPHTNVVLLNQWVEATYMSPRSRAQVQAQMERASECSLRGFLHQRQYQRLLDSLTNADIEWEWCGPPHQRCYERVTAAWADEGEGEGADVGVGADVEGGEGVEGGKEQPVRALLRLFASATFVRMLTDCTDLVLASYDKLELQRWTAGDFTLLPPREHYQHARLEAVMYLGVPERPIAGASTVYVAPEGGEGMEGAEEGGEGAGSDAALVSLPPCNNALNLVYCDAGAASFTKYLSRMAMRDHRYLYILTCTYRAISAPPPPT